MSSPQGDLPSGAAVRRLRGLMLPVPDDVATAIAEAPSDELALRVIEVHLRLLELELQLAAIAEGVE